LDWEKGGIIAERVLLGEALKLNFSGSEEKLNVLGQI